MYDQLNSGKLSKWGGAGDDLANDEWQEIYMEMKVIFAELWVKRFGDIQGQLSMFLFFRW